MKSPLAPPAGYVRRVPVHSLKSVELPTVSVVIPNYNYARYLATSVQSALTQRDVAVEVVIVDDASSDNSLEVAEELAQDSRVSLVRHPQNRGPVDTFNDGLELVSGEFLVRLDADDILTAGSLSRSISLAQEFPEVGLVYGHPVHFMEKMGQKGAKRTGGWARPFLVAPGAVPPVRLIAREWLVWPGSEWLRQRCHKGLNVITSPEALMRTSVVKRVGGQRQLAHTHDMEMWFRIAAYADIGYVAGSDQALHREHAASLSSRESSQLIDLRERLAAFETLFGTTETIVSGNEEMLSSAKRALAKEAIIDATRLSSDRKIQQREIIEDLESFAVSAWPDVRDSKSWTTLLCQKSSTPLVRHVRRAVMAAQHRIIHYSDIARWERWGC